MVEPAECSTDQTHFTSPIRFIQSTANQVYSLEGWLTPVPIPIPVSHIPKIFVSSFMQRETGLMLIKSCTAWPTQEFYMIVSLQCMIWGVKTGVKKERNWELFLKLCAQITELRPLKSTECFTLIPGSQPVLCAISYIRKHWLERFHPQERTHAERLWAGSHSSVVRALAVQVMGPGFNSQQLRVFIQCGFVSNWAKLI